MIIIEMENGKEIKIELDYKNAPNTCKNFVYLADKGFYDGLIFHRVIKNFMIQGGDPQGTGEGGPDYCIKGEFSDNGVNNKLKHTSGVISMARAQDPNSAGSQFFIMHKEAPHLDGGYAAFGRVVSGMDVVNEIATTKTDMFDKPLKEQKIKTIKVVDEEVVEPTKIH
ncbi:MAG: peptidylprolyl isomerase [Bacilli bacterium]|nr:peptidylprolyl isomerase [Bacilli bacterium]MDD3422634.1 peptidylprolyl isomerase [Bacilli bacterium]MDD4065523.1 peptidylprolyl isomerase [Bacilli bacterium]